MGWEDEKALLRQEKLEALRLLDAWHGKALAMLEGSEAGATDSDNNEIVRELSEVSDRCREELNASEARVLALKRWL